jgi:hypothetical protein
LRAFVGFWGVLLLWGMKSLINLAKSAFLGDRKDLTRLVVGFIFEVGPAGARNRHMLARIYQPAKTAMQSGKAKTHKWVLEFEPEEARRIDPLMGYTGSGDMNGQVVLRFESKEQAIAFAEKKNIAFQVSEPKQAKQVFKTYADNFKFGRIGQWTH